MLTKRVALLIQIARNQYKGNYSARDEKVRIKWAYSPIEGRCFHPRWKTPMGIVLLEDGRVMVYDIEQFEFKLSIGQELEVKTNSSAPYNYIVLHPRDRRRKFRDWQ